MRISKLTLTLSKSAYVGMCMLNLSKVLMYKFHDYITNKHANNSILLLTGTGSLMYEIKIEDVYESFRIKKYLIFVTIQLSQNIMMISNKLVVGKMKDETGGVAINKVVELNSKIYYFLVDDTSEYKKPKAVKKYCCNNKS